MNIYEEIGVSTFKSSEDCDQENQDYKRKDTTLKEPKILDEKSQKSIIRHDSSLEMHVMNETPLRRNMITSPIIYDSSYRRENLRYNLLINICLVIIFQILVLVIFYLVFHSSFYLPLNEKLNNMQKENKILEEKLSQLNNSLSLRFFHMQQNIEQKTDISVLQEQFQKFNLSLSTNVEKVLDLTNYVPLFQSEFKTQMKTINYTVSKTVNELRSKIFELSNISSSLKSEITVKNEKLNEQLNKTNSNLVLLESKYEKSFIRVSGNFSDLKKNLNKRVPKGTVSIISLNESLKHFDSSGLGSGEYEGWFICNGLNGTPNLSGRFLVGKDNDIYDFIGRTGGASYVKLSVDQIPEHTHDDKGHSHHIELNSTSNEDLQLTFDWYRTRKGLKDDKNSNLSAIETIKEDQSNIDYHFHLIKGSTNEAKANLDLTGGNLEHENRPPFFVVVYIIFLNTN